MFTGLIERVGKIKGRKSRGSGAVFEIDAGPAPFEVGAGDSVAVEGVCLTAVEVEGSIFKVDVSSESLSRSTLGAARQGGRVNLERALRLGDRLGGHMVTGHVDAMGKIVEVRPEGDFTRVVISAPAEVMALTVEKGSMAVDGISLTVNGVSKDRFWVMIIPETLARTTLSSRKAGDQVNLETDLLGKYVARLLGKSAGVSDKDLLARLGEEGFL